MSHPQPPLDYFRDSVSPFASSDAPGDAALPGLAEASAEPTPEGGFEQHWLRTLAHVLTEEIQELYSSEKLLTEALSSLSQAATDNVFRAVCEAHAEQTREHVRRLEQVHQALGQQSDGRVCLSMEGMLVGLQETIAENDAGPARDERLVATARSIKQFEIAGYCSARDFAQLLGLAPVADLLQKTLDEETTLDARLGNIAEMFVSRMNLAEFQ